MKSIIIKCLKRLLLFVLAFATILTGTIMLLKRNDMLMNVFDNIRYVKIIFISSLFLLLLVLGEKIFRYFYVLDGRVIVVVRGDKYPVSLKTFFKITRLQIILFAKRSRRRVGFVVKSIKNTLLLLPVWLAFITILYFITDRGFWVLIDQAKFSIFTSIVLVCVSELRRAVLNYRQELLEQHMLYHDLMNETEHLIVVYGSSAKGFCENDFFFQPHCYTDNRFEHLCDFLKSINCNQSLKIKYLTKNFKSIDLCLKNIQKMYKKSMNLLCDSIDYWIEEYQNKYQEICQKKMLNQADFICVIENLYQLISCVREPWRRDFEIDRNIAYLLYEECEDKDDLDYYLRLLVDDDFSNEYPVVKKKTIRVKVGNNATKG